MSNEILEFIKEKLAENPKISKTACAELLKDKIPCNSNKALKIITELQEQHNLPFVYRSWGGDVGKAKAQAWMNKILQFIKEYRASGKWRKFVLNYDAAGLPNNICINYNKGKKGDDRLEVAQIKTALVEFSRRRKKTKFNKIVGK
jgi:hypothetical protein